MLPCGIEPGDKFKGWTVVRRVENVHRDRAFLCKCECGKEKVVTAHRLKMNGSFAYCADCRGKHNTKHGDTVCNKKSPIYIAWDNMCRRCLNEQHPMYKHYGGRGITVCDEWKEYIPFKEWAEANGWKKGLSLDRIDNDKGYSPNNCRWTTQKIQCNNTRKNTYATIGNETKRCVEWLKQYGVSDWFVRTRMKKYNVTFAEAINMPRERKKGIYA